MTLTEALSEIKTVLKRISSKREFISQYVVRPDSLKDPLEKDGGSASLISKEIQAIADLQERAVGLRRSIQKANDETLISLEGETKSISDWLIWRREIAPEQQNFLKRLRQNLNSVREQGRRIGGNLVGPGATAEKPQDIIVAINEKQLASDIEKMENILGQLDGQLSLKNATVQL